VTDSLEENCYIVANTAGDALLIDPGGLRFGALQVGVIHTPGHTPGSVCFEIGRELFTGDTVLADRCWVTSCPALQPSRN
jgi:glyoxylase-like metal-dependent hydrolase (beta-lactamase superfamily II)